MIGLQVVRDETIDVTVANGAQIACKGRPQLEYRLRNYGFKGNYYVLPLGECDLILGVHNGYKP